MVILFFILTMMVVLGTLKVHDHFSKPQAYVFTAGGYKGDVLHF